MIPKEIRDDGLNEETAVRVHRKDGRHEHVAYPGHAHCEEPVTHMAAAEEPVSVALELHHHRLDDMLDRIEIDVEAGNWSEARRGFSLFRRELEEHMRLEENLLLPALGMTLQVEGGAAALMRAEHPLIRELLEMIEIGLENECPIGEATDALEVTLADHNANEERLLYPMFERMATPEAYAAVTFELRPLLGTQNGGAGRRSIRCPCVNLASSVSPNRARGFTQLLQSGVAQETSRPVRWALERPAFSPHRPPVGCIR